LNGKPVHNTVQISANMQFRGTAFGSRCTVSRSRGFMEREDAASQNALDPNLVVVHGTACSRHDHRQHGSADLL